MQLDIPRPIVPVSRNSLSRQRVAAYRDNWSRNVELHGRELVEGLDHFYSSVDNLFNGGNFGGIRIEARKPAR